MPRSAGARYSSNNSYWTAKNENQSLFSAGDVGQGARSIPLSRSQHQLQALATSIIHPSLRMPLVLEDAICKKRWSICFFYARDTTMTD